MSMTDLKPMEMLEAMIIRNQGKYFYYKNTCIMLEDLQISLLV